eukprot:TRINITY_DN1727_c0_g1::TRINITY_DN1727_c0_g1_i1::g.25097::m.25097 TRINITY_DN1727_c0_g1::TRINITY_DN1727_c0_g1_i1::g.25097  ORF type:complete len:225 (+),score=75.58 TRINITY_DN1727_c0_g1_i1:41-676(+)
MSTKIAGLLLLPLAFAAPISTSAPRFPEQFESEFTRIQKNSYKTSRSTGKVYYDAEQAIRVENGQIDMDAAGQPATFLWDYKNFNTHEECACYTMPITEPIPCYGKPLSGEMEPFIQFVADVPINHEVAPVNGLLCDKFYQIKMDGQYLDWSIEVYYNRATGLPMRTSTYSRFPPGETITYDFENFKVEAQTPGTSFRPPQCEVPTLLSHQ